MAERRGVHPVVGLAAEIVGLGVEIDPVFLAGDLAGREIVDVLEIACQIACSELSSPQGSRNASARSSLGRSLWARPDSQILKMAQHQDIHHFRVGEV